MQMSAMARPCRRKRWCRKARTDRARPSVSRIRDGCAYSRVSMICRTKYVAGATVRLRMKAHIDEHVSSIGDAFHFRPGRCVAHRHKTNCSRNVEDSAQPRIETKLSM